MDNSSGSTSRRTFLATSGGLLAAAAMPELRASDPHSRSVQESTLTSSPPGKRSKLLIGVFDPVFADLSLDQMLAKVSGYGLEAMEIGTGGYPNNHHCALDELLADDAKLRAWKKKFGSDSELPRKPGSS